MNVSASLNMSDFRSEVGMNKQKSVIFAIFSTYAYNV